MCVYFYIYTYKYTQYTHILYKQTSLDAINHSTALIVINIYILNLII